MSKTGKHSPKSAKKKKSPHSLLHFSTLLSFRVFETSVKKHVPSFQREKKQQKSELLSKSFSNMGITGRCFNPSEKKKCFVYLTLAAAQLEVSAAVIDSPLGTGTGNP